MKKVTIVLGIMLALATSPAKAVDYNTDALESGNPGGWISSLKTFDDEFTVTAGSTFYVDVWLKNVPGNAYSGSLWVDFSSYVDLIDLLSVELFKGPWASDAGITVIGPQEGVPDGAGVGLPQNMTGVPPDYEGDIIIARCGFKALVVGNVTITVNTIPDPDYVEWVPTPPWYDAEVGAHEITIHQLPGDADSDGITDDQDNCPDTPNGPNIGSCTKGTFGQSCTNNRECGICGFCSKNQEDSDQDGPGDVCDPDNDNDGISNVSDNCPFVDNPGQEDVLDGDGVGDICDNCPNDANSNQADWDCDDIGDVCEDSDADGLNDDQDNCPGKPNWLLGGTCVTGNIGVFCMNYQVCGVGGYCSKDQEDTYPPPSGNDIGDACDCEANFDCDQDVDANDVTAFLTDFGRSQYNNPCINGKQCKGDFSCDGDVDANDVTKFLEDFGRSQYNKPCPICTQGQPWCVYP